MGFSRQEYWNGLPCPPPGDLPDPVIEPTPPAASALQVDSLPAELTGKPFLTIPIPSYDMDMNLSKLQEIAEDRGTWWAAVHEVTKSGTQLRN